MFEARVCAKPNSLPLIGLIILIRWYKIDKDLEKKSALNKISLQSSKKVSIYFLKFKLK